MFGGGASISATIGNNKNLPAPGLNDPSVNVGVGYIVYATDNEVGVGFGGKIGVSKLYVAPNLNNKPRKPLGDLKIIESSYNKPQNGIGDLKRSEYISPNSSRSKNISMADLKRM